MQKKILIVALLTLICGGVSVYGLSRPQPSAIPQSATSTTIAVTSGAAPGYDTAPAPLPLMPGATTVVSSSATTSARVDVPPAPKEFVTLIVGTSTYRAPLTASHTVIDSMRALTDLDSSFTFDGEQHTGLGFFVRSINGKAAGSGYNWMLYINGKQADLGASQATVKEGDAVEWKYEK